MVYIHELDSWPDFSWDAEALVEALASVRFRQGRLLGKLESLGFEHQAEASLLALTREVVTSSAIEGEELDRAEVRSSIARRLGLDVAGLPEPGRDVEGAVAMILDATQNHAQPLTVERLFAWHAALFPTGRSGMVRITVGGWRPASSGPMQVVSGPVGHERVHFEAPDATRLDAEMNRFLEWFNRPAETDPILEAAVAHLWFVTIHPFEDGNGWIARAIADMSLSRADGLRERFYSMSSAIEAERAQYYSQLEAAQRGSLDITSWVAWFLGCLDRAIGSADEMLRAVIHKAMLWRKVRSGPVNDRQRTVINRMLKPDWEGHLSTSKYAKLAKCSTDTALRDIRELLERDILLKNDGGGRSTSYRLGDVGECEV